MFAFVSGFIADPGSLRYPFSFVRHHDQPIWDQHSKGDQELTLAELRKIMRRLHRIHGQCKSPGEHCEHIARFYQKIGFELTVPDK